MTDPNVLVIGESLLDIVTKADGQTRELPGGSPMNVAVGLGRLGESVGLATWLGDDARGRTLTDHLHRSGVQILEGSRGADHTSTATVSFDTRGSASYVFDLTWQMPPLPDSLSPILCHTGSIATALYPGADGVRQALAALRRRGTVISYDPNCRPAIIGPADGVREGIEGFVHAAQIVKASDEDLAWLYPGVDPLASIERWRRSGPLIAVLTRGDSGVVGITRTGTVAVPAPSVTVADTVGAGDAFMAGLLHALIGQGRVTLNDHGALERISPGALRSALVIASRVAGITLSRPGADPPRASELG